MSRKILAVVVGLVFTFAAFGQERRNQTFTERYGTQLNLTDTQISNIATLAMGIIPGVVAVIGFATWWARRR